MDVTREIEFRCHAPNATAVHLAGTFNDWRTDATSMDSDESGDWVVRVPLPAGRHEFKFVVDGEWCCEPGCRSDAECPKCVPNDLGSMNRFVDVS